MIGATQCLEVALASVIASEGFDALPAMVKDPLLTHRSEFQGLEDGCARVISRDGDGDMPKWDLKDLRIVLSHSEISLFSRRRAAQRLMQVAKDFRRRRFQDQVRKCVAQVCSETRRKNFASDGANARHPRRVPDPKLCLVLQESVGRACRPSGVVQNSAPFAQAVSHSRHPKSCGAGSLFGMASSLASHRTSCFLPTAIIRRRMKTGGCC